MRMTGKRGRSRARVEGFVGREKAASTQFWDLRLPRLFSSQSNHEHATKGLT